MAEQNTACILNAVLGGMIGVSRGQKRIGWGKLSWDLGEESISSKWRKGR